MPAPLLTFLKYVLLAVLYLFFLRVLRAVWIELREPRVAESEAPVRPSPSEAFAARPASSGGGARVGPPERSAARPEDVTTVSRRHAEARLVVTSPATQSGVSYPLGAEVTVGRAPGCGIALPDDTFVSQLHARVFGRADQWWVEDLGSTNGTLLNDTPVTAPVVIHDGDRLQFGQTVTELRA